MPADRPGILIVDDEVEVLHSLSDLFRFEYRVTICTSGAEAIEKLESGESYAVIVTDQRMPGMTGVDLLGEAMRIQPDATRLLLTGFADIKSVIDSINKGRVFRYISKPWETGELEAVVRQAVDQYRLIQERSALVEELQRNNAQLKKNNRLKQAFLEIASHELNTPVTVILGMIDVWMMSRGESVGQAEQEWLNRLKKAGKRLAYTVERMLKILRCEKLDHSLDARECPLEPLVRSVVLDLAPFLEARRQRVRLEFDPDFGAAEVDPKMIEDVLINLISNAIKFTPDSGEIVVRGFPASADSVRIEVVDSGEGVDENDKQHLFEPFFTGYDTMHHSSGEYHFRKRGIGLGLFIVKTFVKLHGGSVDVNCECTGSTFGFILPRKHLAPPCSAVALAGDIVAGRRVDDLFDSTFDVVSKVS